jgi:hypothetical protein
MPMRSILALALLSPLVAACTPYIPLKADFGTSAAVPKGDIPAEFAAFNAYDANVNPLLARQICATKAIPTDVSVRDAAPGQMVTEHAICETHLPLIGN